MMRVAIAIAFAAHAAVGAAQQASPIPVQLGMRATPDTVTVGQQFVVVIRLRAPAGATVDFPTQSDSAHSASPTAMQLVGTPVVQAVTDSAHATVSAAYRFAAWDVGAQTLGLPDIVVRLGASTGYVSLAAQSVFVRSVLPEDSALRVPKPPRPAIATAPFDWRPWLAALAALVAAFLIWRLWIWYRRRKNAPLDPFSAAEREFDRIEAMHLVETGEPEHHAALMADVMRDYLAARVPEIERSHTSSEILAAAPRVHAAAGELGDILWRADLVKFADARVAPDAAERLGRISREIVKKVEDYMSEAEDDIEKQRSAA